MTDSLRYRLIDEPRPGPLGRIALPPLLVFIVAQIFLPWGALLIAANAVALNGPHRNREIALSAGPIVTYFAALAALDAAVRSGLLRVNQAHYFFVAALALGLLFAAAAYVSQHRTAALRRYLREQG
ncbi:MAG TPA: hypothetical protein VF589_10490 [Allosphingosinicella sp.]